MPIRHALAILIPATGAGAQPAIVRIDLPDAKARALAASKAKQRAMLNIARPPNCLRFRQTGADYPGAEHASQNCGNESGAGAGKVSATVQKATLEMERARRIVQLTRQVASLSEAGMQTVSLQARAAAADAAELDYRLAYADLEKYLGMK